MIDDTPRPYCCSRLAHHVTQRGNHRQTVFFSDHDRNAYLDLLRRHFRQHRLSLIGYCLTSNHVHLVVIPSTVNDLSNGVGGLHQDFLRLEHMEHGQTGHLWQNRFFCALWRRFGKYWLTLN